MSTATNDTQAFLNDTDANFRSWVQFISNLLTAGGLTKRSDTGQINTATVLKPAGVSTSQGYEIREFTDSLAATAPVVFKIEYGSQSNLAANPGIWFTFGTGSDGAGTITGTFKTRFILGVGNNAGLGSVKAKGSCGTGRCVLAFGYNLAKNATGNCIFGFERTKAANWADDNRGIYFAAPGAGNGGGFFGASGTSGYQVIPFTGSLPTIEEYGDAVPPTSGSALAGSDIGVFPFNPSWFGYKTYPPTNWLAYVTGDITADSSVSVDVNGTPITYQTTGVISSSAHGTPKPNSRLMFRYD